jgi:hypothetical protein
MRLLAIPHANVLGLILFFKKNDFIWKIIKISHPTPKCHVRNGSHFGCIAKTQRGHPGSCWLEQGIQEVHGRGLSMSTTHME